jgi:hypothetical protein
MYRRLPLTLYIANTTVTGDSVHREQQVKLINNKKAYMLSEGSNSNLLWFVTTFQYYSAIYA